MEVQRFLDFLKYGFCEKLHIIGPNPYLEIQTASKNRVVDPIV